LQHSNFNTRFIYQMCVISLAFFFSFSLYIELVVVSSLISNSTERKIQFCIEKPSNE